MKFIAHWFRKHLEFYCERTNLLLLIGILIALIGTLIGASDTIDTLRFLHRALVPSVYKIDEGVRELTTFPANGKHAALSQNETGFEEILAIIRENNPGVPQVVVQITNRKEYPVNFYWVQKGDQSAILLDLVQGADEQSEVYPVNYTSIVLPWIFQERTKILASRAFIWIFAGILFDLFACFFGFGLKQNRVQASSGGREALALNNRIRFVIALVVPIIYLNLPDWIFGLSLHSKVRLLFSFTLFLLVISFILLPDGGIKWWFRFCGMQDSEFQTDLDKRFEKVIYGSIYGLLGVFVIVACLYRSSWLPSNWIPHDVLTQYAGIDRRLMWCFGWSIAGFSIAAISDSRRSAPGVKSPFPPYVYFYPSFVIVNSLMIFGLLNWLSARGDVFYSLTAVLALNLGFWIDSINFSKWFDLLAKGVKKLVT